MTHHVNASSAGNPLRSGSPARRRVNAAGSVAMERIQDTEPEPLPIEMLFIPPCPGGNCGCDECDEYLWPRETHD